MERGTNSMINGQFPQSWGASGSEQPGGAYAGAESMLQPYNQGGLSAMGKIQGLGNQFANPEEAFNHFASNYAMSPGAKAKLNMGLSAVRNAMASQGLSGSGAEAEAMTHYTQGIINDDMNDQWNNILNGGRLGLGAEGMLYRGGLQAGADVAGLQEAEEQAKAAQKAQNSSSIYGAIGSVVGSLL